MANKIIVKRDTNGWKIQTWISFGAAFLMCTAGVLNLNGEGLERVLTAVCMFFLLFTTITLSKTIRDNQYDQVDTNSWIMTSKIGFGIALVLTSWSFFRMNIDQWHKMFLVGGTLFLLSSAFTLSKMIRDEMDSLLLEEEKNKQ